MNRQENRKNVQTAAVVDMGIYALRAADIRVNKEGEAQILTRSSIQTPAGYWDDPAAHQEKMTAALKQAVSEAGIAGRAVEVALPRNMAMLRTILLPSAPPEALKGLVTYEAQQYVLYPVEEAVLGFYALSGLAVEEEGGELRPVLLAAVRKSLVLSLISVFEKAGLRINNLRVSSCALAELAAGSMSPVAVTYVTPVSMEIAVVNRGSLLFSRGTAFEGAKEEALERARFEVMRSLNAYMSEQRTHPVERILVAGSDAGVQESFMAGLRASTDIPVELISGHGIGLSDPDAAAYAGGVGLALEAYGGGIAPVNLMPGEEKELRAQVKKRNQTLLWSFVGAVLLLAAILLGSSAYQQNQQKQRELEKVNTTMQQFEKNRLDPRKNNSAALQLLTQNLKAGLHKRQPAVDMLAALTKSLPSSQNLWLTQLSFQTDGSLTLRGKALKASYVTDLLSSLQNSPAFRHVRLSLISDAIEMLPAPSAPLPGLPGKSASTVINKTVTGFVILCAVESGTAVQPVSQTNSLVQGGTSGQS